MENVSVYSPVEDKNIRNSISASGIWSKAYHESDLAVAEKLHATLFHYTIKFDGLKPVMVNSVKKITK